MIFKHVKLTAVLNADYCQTFEILILKDTSDENYLHLHINVS